MASESACPLRILLVDNYDSYTYNLYHLLAVANQGHPPVVVRADSYPSLSTLRNDLGVFDAHVVSPGPGTPHSAADATQLAIDALDDPATPALGVCLGHQILCVTAGGIVAQAPAGPVHGRRSEIQTSRAGKSCPLLTGLPSSFDVVRYHSLAVCPDRLPETLQVTAWAYDKAQDSEEFAIIMAVRHISRPLYGVQFHPESVETEYGHQIAANFVRLSRAHCSRMGLVPGSCPPMHAKIDTETLLTHGAASSRFPRSSPEEPLAALHKHVPSVRAESSDIFSALFGNSDEAFWLDSSNAASSRCCRKSRACRDSNYRSSPEGGKSHTHCGRFSVMGDASGPRAEVVTYDVKTRTIFVREGGPHGRLKAVEKMDIFSYLDRQLRDRGIPLPSSLEVLSIKINGGYFGFCGYETKSDVDGVFPNKHNSFAPDAWYIFSDRLVIFDHEDNSIHLVAISAAEASADERSDVDHWFAYVSQMIDNIPSIADHNHFPCQNQRRNGIMQSNTVYSNETLRFNLERGRSTYEDDIRRCLEYISEGETYEICLTNRIRTQLNRSQTVEALEIYKVLRCINPAPYSAYLRVAVDLAICCSSPERFLRVQPDGIVESKPIKGTRPRGLSPCDDIQLAKELETSVKDRSENLMIVDLVRNDLGRSCAVGTVRVPVLMDVETYATVHQMVSTVRGKLSPNKSAVDCVRHAYPMGSMTGAPKVRTMFLIDTLERSARGVYSGTIGYFSLCGAADLNVVIRTAVVRGSNIEIGTGGAIVSLSDPSDEFAEVIVKGKPLMEAIALAATGSRDYIIEDDEVVTQRRHDPAVA